MQCLNVSSLTKVWSGRPTKDSYFVHRTVSQAETCSLMGFSSNQTAGAAAVKRESVCRIWYPGFLLRTMSTVTPCTDSEPTYFNITCSTKCTSNCLSCTNASACSVCSPGFYLHTNGQCVVPVQCGQGNFAATDTLGHPICEGRLRPSLSCFL